VVLDRLRKFFKAEALPGVLDRPAEMFGGKSAIQFVGDGDGTWEQVLTKYEALFSYAVTQ
jgi:hypothetical protein